MNDYGTGLLGAFSIALALQERNRTGQRASPSTAVSPSPLASSSRPTFLDYEGYQRNDPEGLDLRGTSALSRLYQAADGWFCLHCPDEQSWN